jgi:hypothetical protein
MSPDHALVILATQLERRVPELVVAKYLTERELKRFPVFVSLERGRLSVVPDGWVDFDYSHQQFCLAFELDRDTEGRRNFSNKIEGLLRYVGKSLCECRTAETGCV